MNEQQYAQQALRLIAEHGLENNPVVLWLGGAWLIDGLSPYAHELKPALLQSYAQQTMTEQEVSKHPIGHYWLARNFLQSHPELQQERLRADQTVGIHRVQRNHFPYTVIDTQRIDWQLVSPLLRAPPQQHALILHRLPTHEDVPEQVVSTILTTIPNIQTIILAHAFSTDAKNVSSVFLPCAIHIQDNYFALPYHDNLIFEQTPTLWHDKGTISDNDKKIENPFVVETQTCRWMQAVALQASSYKRAWFIHTKSNEKTSRNSLKNIAHEWFITKQLFGYL